MPVIRQFPGQVCQRCSSTLNLPHVKASDCAEAIHQELDTLLKRVRRLSESHAKMAEQRANEIREILWSKKARAKLR